jgi:serine/threonine protein kinase
MGLDYTVGQRVGDYEVLGVLGAGGMGRVYKVRNVISDRVEAMKIVLPNLANQRELADRFLREIKLLGTLDHPNIAALRTALTIDNELVMIMEYVDGVTLASRLQQSPLAIADTVNYADQVLSALSYAHKLNIIHRDIKPSNMMLTPQGVVKLMDFGLARPSEPGADMTVTNTTLGSVSYMAPEQVKGETVDARSDIYSLGVSLYEMVVGQLPFRGESGYSLMTAHVQETPKAPIEVRPDVPNTLNNIILIAMAKEPAKRFQSADAFRNALKNVAATGATAMAASVSATTSSSPATTQVAASPVGLSGQTQQGRASQAAIPTPPAMPVAAAASTAVPTTSKGNSVDRGIYMALGGLLVVGALFGAGFYLPRKMKAHASPTSTAPAPSVPAAAAPTPSATEAAPVPESPASPASQPAADLTAPSASAKESPSSAETQSNKNLSPQIDRDLPAAAAGQSKVTSQPTRSVAPASSAARTSSVASTAQQPEAGATPAQQMPPPAPANNAEIEQMQHEVDQLTSRAMAVSQSLDGVRRGQAAQGLGLRGDMAASEQRMKTDLGAAQAALDKQDAAGAKKYMDYAAAEAEKLEKFLGR